MSALFLKSLRRVWRVDDEALPDSVRDKALSYQAEGIEAEELAEDVFGDCGIPYEEKERGVSLSPCEADAPQWSVYDRGEGVSLTGSVSDVPKFLKFLSESPATLQPGTFGLLTRHELRRLLYLDTRGGLLMQFRPVRGRYMGTVADFEADRPEWPTAELSAAVEKLEGLWTDYVEALARRAVKALRAAYDWRTDWARIVERCNDMGEGIDERGHLVPLSECEEGEADE